MHSTALRIKRLYSAFCLIGKTIIFGDTASGIGNIFFKRRYIFRNAVKLLCLFVQGRFLLADFLFKTFNPLFYGLFMRFKRGNFLFYLPRAAVVLIYEVEFSVFLFLNADKLRLHRINLLLHIADFIHVFRNRIVDFFNFTPDSVALFFRLFEFLLVPRLILHKIFETQQSYVQLVGKNIFFCLAVAACFFRLDFKRVVRAFDFRHRHFDLLHIAPRLLKLALGNSTFRLAAADSSSLFKQITAVFRSTRKNLVDFPLLHDRVRRLSDSRIHEQFYDFPSTDRAPVDKIFVFSGAVEPPLYCNFGLFKRQKSAFVAHRKRNFGNV